MKVTATPLNDVLLIESPVYSDDRGFFNEIYQHERFQALGLSVNFVQDNHSRSNRDVLRGMHFQRTNPQGKLVRAIQGSIFDVAVDLRQSSSTYGRWFGTTLVAGDGRQLWIPPGFAHGFAVLSETADVFYKCTEYYNQSSEESLAWDDREVGIEWPTPTGAQFQLSAKDAQATPFAKIAPFP